MQKYPVYPSEQMQKKFPNDVSMQTPLGPHLFLSTSQAFLGGTENSARHNVEKQYGDSYTY